jgi:hypothetical protein
MPVALEQPPVHHSTQTPRLRRARRVVAIAIRLAILAAIVAIFAGGYYLARRGYGDTASWKSYTNAASKPRSDG